MASAKILASTWVLAMTGLLAAEARAAGLSGQLSADDIRQATAQIALGSLHRSWTAPALEHDGLGLDLGVETTFLFRRTLADEGDHQAVLPRVIPVPRLWMAWELPANFEVSASVAPGFLFDGVGAYGAGLQWEFLEDEDIATKLTLVGTYTYSESFGDLSAHAFDVAVQASRDLRVWQPYAGLGLATAFSSVEARLVAPGVGPGTYTVARPHFYVGAHIDLLAKLAFQVDFASASPSFSLLLAQEF